MKHSVRSSVPRSLRSLDLRPELGPRIARNSARLARYRLLAFVRRVGWLRRRIRWESWCSCTPRSPSRSRCNMGIHDVPVGRQILTVSPLGSSNPLHSSTSHRSTLYGTSRDRNLEPSIPCYSFPVRCRSSCEENLSPCPRTASICAARKQWNGFESAIDERPTGSRRST
jgi:hypothetical protein